MKKKVLLLLVLALCMTALTTGTLAYFTGEETAHNVITSGGVNIGIVEKQEVPGDDGTTKLVDFPGRIEGVMPGTTVSKIVSVKNIGASEAWIRVKVEATITGTQTDQNQDGKLSTDVMSYDIQEGWVKGNDGYYYYKNPVQKDQTTGELFNGVTFSKDMDDTYQNCTVNINITAQAVQTANNPIPEGGDVTQIVGWPAAA